jgi:sugar-specific transcriptional regulator TrmB
LTKFLGSNYYVATKRATYPSYHVFLLFAVKEMSKKNIETTSKLRDLGFSQYETSCYLALVANHPSNGSQLSKLSGVARSRIYDVLRNMSRKGLVQEVGGGQYVPIPPDELVKRLRHQFESNLSVLEEQFRDVANESTYEYIWAIFGYHQVIKRAIEMIKASRKELYVRLFPEAAKHLNKYLHDALKRDVKIRYIAMGKIPLTFDVQVIHPNPETLIDKLGGYSFDIIADRSEALVGIFETGNEEHSPINWTRNRWFVIANRDSLRHDFYHYFLHKMYEQKQELSERDKNIYEVIKADN